MEELIILIIGLILLYFLSGFIASKIVPRTTTLCFPRCIDEELNCPECGSKNFTAQGPFLTTPFGTMSAGGYEKCGNCGYYKHLGGGLF